MQLEVNKNHKRIEFGNLKKPLERFTIGILGTTMAISLYSGALIPTAYAMREATGEVIVSEDDKIADIPSQYQTYIRSQLFLDEDAPITESMLNRFDFLHVNIGDNADLEYLKFFPNLTDVSIRDYDGRALNLDTIGSLPNLKSISLYAYCKGAYLEADSLKFLDSLNVDSITLHGYFIYPGCEESLNKISNVHLSDGYYDFDFSKLTGISKLDFAYDDVYDYSIYFSRNDYDTLVSNGVEVDLGRNAEKFFEIDARLNGIVESLGVSKDSSDKEKLDAVLLYVLDNLEYDEYVSSQLALGVSNEDGHLSKDFYIGGFLYGALEKDSAICGNYAALVEALLNRLGCSNKSAFVHNETHAWNIVKVDGEPYLVDATWLDEETISVGHQVESTDSNGNHVLSIEFDDYTAVEALRSGKSHLLRWYMERLNEEYIQSIDQKGSHEGAHVPEYMLSENGDMNSDSVTLSPDEDEEVKISPELQDEIDNAPDITDRKVKIKIGKKELVIAAGALIGVMNTLGVAILIHNKRKADRRRRHRYGSDITFDDFNDYDGFGGYGRR